MKPYTKYGVTHDEAPVNDPGWEWRFNGTVERFTSRSEAMEVARAWVVSPARTGPRIAILWRFRDGADPVELARWSQP